MANIMAIKENRPILGRMPLAKATGRHQGRSMPLKAPSNRHCVLLLAGVSLSCRPGAPRIGV